MDIWNTLSAFGSWVEEHLKDIFSVIGKVLSSLTVVFHALVGILGNVLKGHFEIFSSAAKWVSGITRTLIKKWIPGIIAEVQGIYHKVRNWANPVIQTIHRIRQIQQAYFDTYVRPVLNFIQKLRQSLLILRLMHVKFATALDQRLADIEYQIMDRFDKVLIQLNTVSDYLNYILDPTGLFDGGLYMQTALRSIGALFNALHDAQQALIGAKDAAENTKMAHYFDLNTVVDRIAKRSKSGPTAEDLANRASVRSAFQEMGYRF